MAKIRFDVHPSVEMMRSWLEELPERTGRSLEAWIRVIAASGCTNEKAARGWLKAEHALGANTAWWLAERAFAKDLSLMDDDPERYLALAPRYVDEQFAGKKSGLRPIFDSAVRLARGLGKDVKVCPCKTIVPFYRSHVFAQVRAATNARVDLGLCLTAMVKAGKKLPPRLLDTGGFAKKDRITHRIALEREEDLDEFVVKWLRTAYELDGTPETKGARRSRAKGTAAGS